MNSAWAAENLYWTGATSTDYNTAGNWSANVSPVGRTQWYHTYDTAHIQSYRIDIAGSYGTRGGWWINAGTENEPVQFYCETASQGISPNNSVNSYDYASYLYVADKSDAWAWFNGGKYNKFQTHCTIGSSSYAGHLIIGNDRGVDTLFNAGGNFTFNQGSVAISNATVNIGGELTVGNTAGKLTSFNFYNSTMVIGNYFQVGNSALFDLCGGSITNTEKYLTVDNSAEMTIQDGGRYACQSQIIVGNYGAGRLNIIDGGEAASGSMLTLGYRSGSSGTVNIANGGILTVPYIYQRDADASATVALDGGTIRAAKDSQTLIQANANLHVTVGANGGTIDAAGYNVTIAEDLDNASGETGAMTFKGGGTVTLSGAINYTGGTTVEAGTVVVVPDVAKRTALGTITVMGLENNICEVVRLSGEGTFSAGDLPADTETVTFSVSPDGKSILAVSGLESSFWIGGSGDLGAASNWSDGVMPTENPTIKWASPITLTNSGGFSPNTLTIPDDSAVVTLAGALTVNCLTNASRLAVASGATLTVVENIVATPTVSGGTSYFLYSNEGTVTVGGEARGIGFDGWPRVYQYQVANANTQPIRARKLVYDCPGGKRIYMHLSSAGDKPGKWVVGEDGMTFAGTRQVAYTKFLVENSGADVTLYSSADWTLKNTGVNKTDNGDLHVRNNATLTIDTSDYDDYDDSTIRRTVTLEGRLYVESTVTITGCGTVEIATTKHNGLAETTVASGKTLAVTDTATLKVNAGKKILGNGTISLAAGTTLALESTDREFATPDIVPVTLPAEGAATIRIDGTRLRSGEHVLCTLASVPENLADHVNVTGTALGSRKYEVKAVEETVNEAIVTKLVLTIYPDGLMVIVR